jgi:hypothetical protein
MTDEVRQAGQHSQYVVQHGYVCLGVVAIAAMPPQHVRHERDAACSREAGARCVVVGSACRASRQHQQGRQGGYAEILQSGARAGMPHRHHHRLYRPRL